MLRKVVHKLAQLHIIELAAGSQPQVHGLVITPHDLHTLKTLLLSLTSLRLEVI